MYTLRRSTKKKADTFSLHIFIHTLHTYRGSFTHLLFAFVIVKVMQSVKKEIISPKVIEVMIA